MELGVEVKKGRSKGLRWREGFLGKIGAGAEVAGNTRTATSTLGPQEAHGIRYPVNLSLYLKLCL